jgi:hypothetical protein
VPHVRPSVLGTKMMGEAQRTLLRKPTSLPRKQSKGAPGLAFETGDPCNRIPTGNPTLPCIKRPQGKHLEFLSPTRQIPTELTTLPFVIPSAAEGSAVSLHRKQMPHRPPYPGFG